MTAAPLLARLVGAVLFLYRATLKVERLHFDRCLALKARGVPILFTLWHGRMLLSIQAHRREGIVTMASRSKDGEIIARWLERNGYVVVRGSTTRGGGQALREMVRQVRGGRHAALTVDGPRGPARVVQPGVVQLARLTGVGSFRSLRRARGRASCPPGTATCCHAPFPTTSLCTASLSLSATTCRTKKRRAASPAPSTTPPGKPTQNGVSAENMYY